MDFCYLNVRKILRFNHIPRMRLEKEQVRVVYNHRITDFKINNKSISINQNGYVVAFQGNITEEEIKFLRENI